MSKTSSSVKAWELHAKPGFDSLTLTERPSEAPVLGANDVRARVHAVSLNYRDLIIAKGAEKRSAGSPLRVPASDGAGEVTEVGSKVTRWKVGDRVMASFFPNWVDGELSDAHHASALGGNGADGMLREEVVLPEHSWVRIPASLSFEEASTLPCAGVTAWQALFEVASLRPGDTVLLQGSGGVSVFALQLAKSAGARVLMTSSSAKKGDRLRAMGAEEIIDYSTNPKWGERARALTANNRGVDLVVDVGGQATFDQSSAALRYGGTMSMLGVLTGGRGEVNLYSVFHRRQIIRGVYVGSVSMFERLAQALDRNAIKPIVDRVFPFIEARAAYDYLESGSHLGKVVVKVS